MSASQVLAKHGSWIVAGLIALGSATAAYFHSDTLSANRLTVVETNRTNDKQQLDRVEEKVDKVYDKLIEWEHVKK